MMKPNPLSFQMKLNPEDFLPATDEEKRSWHIKAKPGHNARERWLLEGRLPTPGEE